MRFLVNIILIFCILFVSAGSPEIEVHSDHIEDSQHQSDVTFHNVNHQHDSSGPIDVNHCDHIHIHSHGTSVYLPHELALNFDLNETYTLAIFSNHIELKSQFSYKSHYRPPIA